MKRSHIHLFTDMLLFLGVLGLVLTGLLMWLILPAGSRQASVWGLTRHDWGDVHFWIAAGILAVGLLHLFLNWGWVYSVLAKALRLGSSRPTKRRQLGSGLATALILGVLIGGFLYTADAGKVAHVQGQGHSDGHGMGRGQLERELEDLFLGEP